MKVDDAKSVAEQYANEANLGARRSLYANAQGPDPREIAFTAVAESQPRRVLEVGGGPGELAARMGAELDAEVVMVDVAPRMVVLARARGVDARVGDAQQLPFAEGSFDCVVAAWMLFHLPDLDRGIAELARVLRSGGRLVAVTNGEQHLLELRELAGSAAWERPFTRENGAELLGRHFAVVERRDADGWITVDDAETVHRYVASLMPATPSEPPPFTVPFRSRRACSVFVATR